MAQAQVSTDEAKVDATVASKEDKSGKEKEKKKKAKKMEFDKDIELEYEYGVPVKLIFNALTKKEILNKIFFGKFDLNEESGEFKLEGLSGKIVEKTFNEKENTAIIKEDWRQQSWPQDHNSIVLIELSSQDSSTCTVTLTHSKIPKYDKYDNGNQRAAAGNVWRELFIRGLKQFVGYPLLNG